MNAQVTLSVLMPNYNHARFVGEALEAILGQSRQPDEIIVIDDASTDDSVEIIAAFARRHPNVRLLVNERNRGTVYTLNRLLHLASGRYVCFPGADDKVLPDFFKTAVDMLERYPQAELVSGISRLISVQGVDLGDFCPPLWAKGACWLTPQEVLKTLERHGPWIMGNTVVYRRDNLLGVGGFRSELGSFADGFVSMVIALRNGACFVPVPFSAWRRMESGFAWTESANEQRYFETTSRAAELMRTEYRDLFSRTFVERWERSRLEGWRVQTATRRYLERQRLRSSAGPQVVDRLLDRAAQLRLFAFKAYCALRYRRPLLHFLVRTFRKLVVTRQRRMPLSR